MRTSTCCPENEPEVPRGIVEPMAPMRVKGMRELVTAYLLHRLATPLDETP